MMGKSLGELNLRNKYGVQIIVVKVGESEKRIVIPRADYMIQENDTLVIMGSDQDLKKVQNIK